jgi:diguanylate cyclase (GGDEF)-like protein
MCDDGRSAGDQDRPVETDQAAQDRDQVADDRDQTAEDHDRASDARDEKADVRDVRAEARERAADAANTGAASDRAGAWRDRRGGASDRTRAADDRVAARTDRFASAQERTASSIDELTRAHRRDAGIVELEREVARAKRTKQSLTLAFVDVDDLKRRNDSLGHAAGDQLLRATANAIRAHLRSYDLIIRFGGDEFVCALPDVTMAEAAKRFSLVNADLAATHEATVTVGLTELGPDDALEEFIERADEAMYRHRHA